MTCLSDLALDEMLAGEHADGAAHLASCARCRAREQILAGDRSAFRVAIPRLHRPSRVWLGAGIAASLAAAAAVMLVIRAPDHGTRTKGRAHLSLVVGHGSSMQLADRAHPGDTLAYLVTTTEPSYVAVLGRDANQRITTYVSPTLVAAGRDSELPIATHLDATLGHEQVLAVFCAAPVAIAVLVDSVDHPPDGCTVDRVDLEKVP